ncbi:MAG: hypothetical protein A3K00_08205 [Gallionellales bacterium RIFOXYD2_FULL_52_7]|jgi:hypothetical protein|nr:MAG: hypothetical protein A3K00_08205 [Gallionellales bacterium RIFOXYD2_FULL_52_7]
MNDSQPDFEPTRSFAYRFVRYTVLPEVTKEVAKLGEAKFLLREIAWPIIDHLLTKEQQAVRVLKAKSEGDDSMSSIVRFYVNFLAKGLDLYESLGEGYFRAYTESEISEDDMVDAAIDSGDEEASEFEGWIYAFSFPSIVKTDGAFPIKVGKTVGDVGKRVADQVKGSATFEQPVILGRWQVKRVGPSELAIHNVLKARSKWRENAPGTEWFDSTVAEVESIIDFVSSK